MEMTGNVSTGTFFVDTLFEYLFSFILGSVTLFLLFIYFAQGAGLAIIGLFIWFVILFVPLMIVVSIVYLTILKAILKKHPLPQTAKWIAYPCIGILAIVLLYYLHLVFPH